MYILLTQQKSTVLREHNSVASTEGYYCWAHNPKADGSKLSPATYFVLFFYFFLPMYILLTQQKGAVLRDHMYSVASTEGYFFAGDALYSPFSVIPNTS